MSDDLITLRLSRSESLVLFEYLASLDETPRNSEVGEAEQTVLWRIEGQLESVLVEVVASNYLELVEIARAEVISP